MALWVCEYVTRKLCFYLCPLKHLVRKRTLPHGTVSLFFNWGHWMWYKNIQSDGLSGMGPLRYWDEIVQYCYDMCMVLVCYSSQTGSVISKFWYVLLIGGVLFTFFCWLIKVRWAEGLESTCWWLCDWYVWCDLLSSAPLSSESALHAGPVVTRWGVGW